MYALVGEVHMYSIKKDKNKRYQDVYHLLVPDIEEQPVPD